MQAAFGIFESSLHFICANELDWQNEGCMIRSGYCNEYVLQIMQAACQYPKSSLHPRMFALNGGQQSNPTIHLPFQSVKLKPSAGCFLCVMRQTMAQQLLTPSPVGEGWGEGFSGYLPISGRAAVLEWVWRRYAMSCR